MLGQPINVASNNLADEGGRMRKKRLFAFSLIIAFSVSYVTPQTNPSYIASAQDVKVKQDGFITGCSETVIDALDECIQERFSKSDQVFGYDRVTARTRHVNLFEAENQSEREAISELEKDGWQVAFYLIGRRILGQKPDLSDLKWRYRFQYPSEIHGPVAITAPSKFEERVRNPARDSKTGSFPIIRDTYDYNEGKMIEQFELPEPMSIWDDAQKAMLAFEKRDQYDFSYGKWSIAARPIRAKESCLKCHTGDPATAPGVSHIVNPFTRNAPRLAPPKVGDALGVAMYAYALKQKGASALVR
jgi:hypothetical protein